jgi:hypothetical protein
MDAQKTRSSPLVNQSRFFMQTPASPSWSAVHPTCARRGRLSSCRRCRSCHRPPKIWDFPPRIFGEQYRERPVPCRGWVWRGEFAPCLVVVPL